MVVVRLLSLHIVYIRLEFGNAAVNGSHYPDCECYFFGIE